MTDRHVLPAAVRVAMPKARGRRRRPARNVLAAMLGRILPILAAAFLVAGAPDRMAQAQSEPTLTIAAQQDSYGFGIDDVVFTVTRSGTAEGEINGSVTLSQDQTFLDAGFLRWNFSLAAEETSTDVEIFSFIFENEAPQSGDLTATIEAGNGYTVGTPGSATTRVVVVDPAVTVRPERAAYRFDEGVAPASITLVARTAPSVPLPNSTFAIEVYSDAASGTASVGDDYEALFIPVLFGPLDFTAVGGVWEARKKATLTIIDDSVAEPDESLELRLRRGAFTPERIRPRNADGSACADDVCTVPVTIRDNDGSLPTLTIAAERDAYGFGIDNVVFTVTRTGTAEGEISGAIDLTQDENFVSRFSRASFTIPANETSTDVELFRLLLDGDATQSGGLTATIKAGDGYTVGTPGSATVRMVVADPAVTVRPELAAYSFDEDGAEATIAVVARTAPGVPPPSGTFAMHVFSDRTSGTATVGDDYEVLGINVVFGTADFTAAGDVWEARKEVSLTIVVDDVAEAAETVDVRFRRTVFTPERIRPRNADGSACADDVCTVPVTIRDNDGSLPTLTIAAERDAYGFGIDNVVFTVTRTGTAEGEISGAVDLTQDENFVGRFSRASFTIPANETSTDVELFRLLLDGDATQSGGLTATIKAGDGYTVGTPGSATVRMVVADPAVMVRPELAAYSFDEDGAEATIAVVARTAPGVPPPSGTFAMHVFSDRTSGTATVGDDYEVLGINVVFGPDDFTATGGVWEARKEVSLTIVDDDVAEAAETIDVRFRRTVFTPERIRPRNADGSACVDDVCTVPVTIAANDGTAVERIAISPVPPEASADHGPYYPKDAFLALPDGAVHGRGATLTFTLNLDTEVTVTGTPELVLDIFDRERRARYTGGSGTRQLTFVWTVAKGDNDPDGLEFRFLDLKGGTIRDGQGQDLLPEVLPAQHFAEHRVRGGLHAMRLEVSGSAREGEPFEIRVVRNGGFEEVAVALVGVADSALPLIKPSSHYAENGPGRRQFDFDHGAANEPGVQVSTRTVTPPGDGVADASRTLTIRLTGTDVGFHLTPPLGNYRAWYLAEGPLEVTVPVIDTGLPLGEAGLRVHGASVREAPGAKLAFKVTLSPHSEAPVTVDYQTGDDPFNEPKAIAGSDYVATSGTLTFEPGETLKTVEVEVLADDHDESFETMRLFLSNAQGARIDDASGLGVIKNTGPIPKAWIARFGRTVADQVLDAVESRMRAARRPGVEMTIGGQRVGSQGAVAGSNAGSDRASGAAAGLSGWLTGGRDPVWREGPGLRSRLSRGATQRDLLGRTSFAVTAETGRRETVSLWGRGAVTRFDGREGKLSLDGEVSSAMVGADWARGPESGSGADAWTAGLIVSHSVGEGGYAGNSEGRVEATLTGLYPWGRLALSERVEVWGAAGYGTGELSVTPKKPGSDEDDATIRTDLDLWMASAGLRGVLVDGGPNGLTLTGKTDALIVQTASDAARGSDGGGLAAARASVTRLRLGLEGSRPFSLGSGGVVTPSVEIGMRHDDGDAETGFGVDMGGGIAWTLPKHGKRLFYPLLNDIGRFVWVCRC